MRAEVPDGDPQSGVPSVLRDLEGVAVGPSGVKSRLGRRARQHQSHPQEQSSSMCRAASSSTLQAGL